MMTCRVAAQLKTYGPVYRVAAKLKTLCRKDVLNRNVLCVGYYWRAVWGDLAVGAMARENSVRNVWLVICPLV